jgi:ABC-type lipoprotein export system ATPase subunit
MIELTDVVKMYDNGRRAINGVSLTVYKGENVLIAGAAGSGKTTLLKLIAGMESPSAGSIVVDGKAVDEMDSDSAAGFRNRICGILLCRPGFMGTLTMLENITLPLTVRKASVKERNQSAMEYMNELDIGHLTNAYPSQLSVMELQLSNLARALVAQPKILLLDNMDADLTTKEQTRILNLLYAIWKSSELTIIRFIDRENGGLPCDRHFRLEYGQITED